MITRYSAKGRKMKPFIKSSVTSFNIKLGEQHDHIYSQGSHLK